MRHRGSYDSDKNPSSLICDPWLLPSYFASSTAHLLQLTSSCVICPSQVSVNPPVSSLCAQVLVWIGISLGFSPLSSVSISSKSSLLPLSACGDWFTGRSRPDCGQCWAVRLSSLLLSNVLRCFRYSIRSACFSTTSSRLEPSLWQIKSTYGICNIMGLICLCMSSNIQY